MQEEITKIIQMVEDGKVSSEEASKLISALNEDKEASESSTSKGAYMGKSVKINIHSQGKEAVNMRIPIRFVKWILKTGHGFASAIPEAKAYVDDIDMDAVMAAIDQGAEGKIIDMETEEGDSIAVYIE